MARGLFVRSERALEFIGRNQHAARKTVRDRGRLAILCHGRSYRMRALPRIDRLGGRDFSRDKSPAMRTFAFPCLLRAPFFTLNPAVLGATRPRITLRNTASLMARPTSSDQVAFDEMKRLSGQTKAPTMRWDDEILADFGADELDVFLRERNVVK